MTDEEAKKTYEDLKKTYGDKLANPDVFPNIFEYQVKLYKYYKRTVNEANESGNDSGTRH